MSASVRGPFVLLACTLCLNAQNREVEALLARLSSTSWSERAEAFLIVEGRRDLRESEALGQPLVALLNSENDYIAERYLSGEGVEEAFSGYYDRLLGFVMNVVGLSTDEALRAVVEGSYNPESAIASRIAAVGPRVVPVLVEHLWATKVDPNRWNCVAILGRLLERDAVPGQSVRLEPHLREIALEAILMAAASPETVTRRYAARSLGMARDSRALPVLERLMLYDPDDGSTSPWSSKRSVRDEAKKAIDAIKAGKK